MVITPQFICMVLGIVAFVLSAILAVMSTVYFFRNDIRGVMDDLNGKSRQAGGTSGRRSSRKRPRNKPQEYSRKQAAQGTSEVGDVPGGVVQPAEDDLDTVLDTKLRSIAAEYEDFDSDISGINDDMPTVITSLGDYHQNDVAETNLEDADVPTAVEQEGDDIPTEVERVAGTEESSFVVTKSIVALHSQEVIIAG